jgi:uncharacterized protein YoxC
MKVFLLFSFLLLVTCEVRSKNIGTRLCFNKNPFLKDLVTKDPLTRKVIRTQIFPIPQFGGADVCQAEWGKYGTCCEPTSLKKMFVKELQFVATSVMDLQDSVNDLRIFGKRTATFLFRRRSLSKEARKLASAFRRFAEHTHVINFKHNSKMCWNYMNHLRASAMCPICSGRSEIFFKGDSILISPTTCLAAVSSCNSFFTSLRSITANFSDLTETYKKHVDSDGFELWRLMELVKELEVNKPPRYLVDLFQKLTESKTQKGIGQLSAQICSMIVSVRKKPYVSVFHFKDFKKKLALLVSKGVRHFVETFAKAGEALEDFSFSVRNKFKNVGRIVNSKFNKFGKDVKRHFEKIDSNTRQAFDGLSKKVKNSNREIKTKMQEFGKKTKKGFEKFGNSVASTFKPKKSENANIPGD